MTPAWTTGIQMRKKVCRRFRVEGPGARAGTLLNISLGDWANLCKLNRLHSCCASRCRGLARHRAHRICSISLQAPSAASDRGDEEHRAGRLSKGPLGPRQTARRPARPRAMEKTRSARVVDKTHRRTLPNGSKPFWDPCMRFELSSIVCRSDNAARIPVYEHSN
jgi:hypothetical protein